MSPIPQNNLIDTSVDITDFFKEVKKKWVLYIVSLVVFLSLAYIYNNTAVKKYKVGSTILINIKEDNNKDSDFLSTNSLNYFGRNTTFSNELQAFGSTPLIRKALSSMEWKVSYYEKRLFGFKNIYAESPFKIIINEKNPQIINTKIELKFIDENTCSIVTENSNVELYNYEKLKKIGIVSDIEINKIVQVGQMIEEENYSFIILFDEDKFEADIKDKVYAFELNSLSELSNQIKSKLTLSPLDVESSVINIELIHSNSRFAMEFIQNLTDKYMLSNLEKKNHAALQTINYIDRQIGNIKDSLNITESNFKILELQTKL